MLRTAEREAVGEQADWAAAFLALALHSAGQPDAALSVALRALGPHMTEYGRAATNYAQALDQT